MVEMDEQETPLQVSTHDDDTESRPPLPPRPTKQSVLSPTTSVVTSHSREFSLRRKPVTPRRSSRLSLDKRSYEVLEMAEADSDDGLKDSAEGPTSDLSRPKAFHKTHLIFRWNFGYWRMPARHFTIFAVLFLVTFLPLWYSQYGFDVIQNSSIEPFYYDCNESQGWTFVGISLQFGNFSFGEAKAIDLAWNWVVGRGLQGILTVLAYRVFCDALVRAIELTAIPYDLYVTWALPSTKIGLLWKLTPALFKYGAWRVKAIFAWMIISTLYLIAVPGLMDAATAYESLYTTDFSWRNGTVNDLNMLKTWATNPDIVHPTHICASYLTNYSYVDESSVESAREIYNFTYVNYNGTEGSQYNTDEYQNWSSDCTLLSKIRTDSEKWQQHEVVLIYNFQDQTLNDSWWQHFEEYPYESLRSYMWKDWGFYPANPTSFRCSVSQLGVYQWGFSFEWLFMITVLNSVWLWGLWILWVDCDTNSEFCRKRRRLGTWRAIADVAEAMQESLGPNMCAYSESELWEALRKQPPIKYYSTRPKGGEPGHIGLSSRSSERPRLLWNQEYGKKDR